MKWLLIGGAGFIGSNLTRELCKEGHSVVVYDIVHTPKVKDVGYIYIRGTRIPDYTELYNLMANAEIIVHLASIVGVDNVMDDPHTMFFENIEMAKMIHKANSVLKVPLFYASSSEVYGHNETAQPTLLHESDKTVVGHIDNPRFMYACAKRSIESIFHLGEYPTVIGRLFNVSGPYQDSEKGVISKMVRDAIYDRTITVNHSGEQARTFTHVNTVCEAIIELMSGGGSAYNQLFNLSSYNHCSINAIAEIIKTFLSGNRGFDVTIKHPNKASKDPFMNRKPSVVKLQQYIQVSKYSIPEIIADTLDYREQRDDAFLMEATD